MIQEALNLSSPDPLQRAQAERDFRRAFRLFHEANPGVYQALCRLARQAKAAGHNRIGISLIWDALRWEQLIGQTRSTDGYKLNDHHKAFYARLMMEQEKDLEGMFETRRGTWVE